MSPLDKLYLSYAKLAYKFRKTITGINPFMKELGFVANAMSNVNDLLESTEKVAPKCDPAAAKTFECESLRLLKHVHHLHSQLRTSAMN